MIGAGGVQRVLMPELTEEEREALRSSARLIADTVAQLPPLG